MRPMKYSKVKFEVKVNYLDKRESARIIAELKDLKWGKALMEIKLRENILNVESCALSLYKISKFLICKKENMIFPTLHEEYNREILMSLPTLVVDMGAVPHIAKGADVMRPGIKKIEGEFKAGDLVAVRDERHLKSVAIAVALTDSKECEKMSKGKIAENIHHIDDGVWKLVQKIKHLLDK